MAQFEDIQNQLAQTRKDYGQRVADYPTFEKDLRKEVYGSDQILPKLRSQKDQALMELWNADKRLSDRYANPESEMFIRDPYKRESVTSDQYGGILEGLAGTTRLAERREDMLGDILERGVKIFELGLSAKSREHDMLRGELDAMLKQADMAEKKADQAQATSKEESINEIIKYIMSDVDITDPNEITETLKAVGSQQPEVIPDLIGFLGTLPKQQEGPITSIEDAHTKFSTGADRNKFAEHLDYLSELNQIRSGFTEADVSSNFLANLFEGQTGPLSSLAGQKIGPQESRELRSKLEGYRTKVRKGLYGSVLTEREIQEAKKYLPGTGVQEGENLVRIETQLQEKETNLKNFLLANGFSMDEVEVILEYTKAGTNEDASDLEGIIPGSYLNEADSLLGDF